MSKAQEEAKEKSAPDNKKDEATWDDLLYDPEGDEADERWVREHIIGSQPEFKTDARLDCPSCFTTVSLCCQRHERYHNQYRAIFVLNCRVSKTIKLAYDEEAEDHLSPWKEGDGAFYRPVRCATCKELIGVKDEDDVFHFFNVFAVPPRGLSSVS